MEKSDKIKAAVAFIFFTALFVVDVVLAVVYPVYYYETRDDPSLSTSLLVGLPSGPPNLFGCYPLSKVTSVDISKTEDTALFTTDNDDLNTPMIIVWKLLAPVPIELDSKQIPTRRVSLNYNGGNRVIYTAADGGYLVYEVTAVADDESIACAIRIFLFDANMKELASECIDVNETETITTRNFPLPYRGNFWVEADLSGGVSGNVVINGTIAEFNASSLNEVGGCGTTSCEVTINSQPVPLPTDNHKKCVFVQLVGGDSNQVFTANVNYASVDALSVSLIVMSALITIILFICGIIWFWMLRRRKLTPAVNPEGSDSSHGHSDGEVDQPASTAGSQDNSPTQERSSDSGEDSHSAAGEVDQPSTAGSINNNPIQERSPLQRKDTTSLSRVDQRTDHTDNYSHFPPEQVHSDQLGGSRWN